MLQPATRQWVCVVTGLTFRQIRPISVNPTRQQTSSQKKKTGFLSPRRLINRIKSENALFSNFMHQVGSRGPRLLLPPALHLRFSHCS